MTKKYIIFAGVNGAGKSTLYQTNSLIEAMPRINVDEIVREFGSWKNNDDVLKAGRIAVRRLNEYFASEISFSQETTLCGQSIRKNIVRAKQLGYEVELYYIGLDSVSIAKERVKQRVLAGGHGIPDKDIERRYTESFNKLKELYKLCDIVILYDNSDYFCRIATYIDGVTRVVTDRVPEWFTKLGI